MATGNMEQAPLSTAHISALKSCQSVMEETLDLPSILDMCCQENIITNEMMGKILSRSNKHKQCKEFIGCLEGQSTHAFNLFIHILKEDYGFLAKKIEKKLWRNILESSKFNMQLANSIADKTMAHKISQSDEETLRDILRNVEALLQKCTIDSEDQNEAPAKQKELEAQGFSNSPSNPSHAQPSAPQAFSPPYHVPPNVAPSAPQAYSSPYALPPSAPGRAPQGHSSPQLSHHVPQSTSEADSYCPPPPYEHVAYNAPSATPAYSSAYPHGTQAQSSPHYIPTAPANAPQASGYNTLFAASSNLNEPTQNKPYKGQPFFGEKPLYCTQPIGKIKLIKEKTMHSVKSVQKIEVLKNGDILLKVKKNSKLLGSKELALMCDPDLKPKKTLVEKDVLSLAAKEDIIAIACQQDGDTMVRLFTINGEYMKDIKNRVSPKSMTFYDQNTIVYNNQPGKLCYLDITTGEVINTRFYHDTEEVISLAVAKNNHTIIASETSVICINGQGEKIFVHRGSSLEMISSVCVDHLGYIFVGGTNINALNQQGESVKEKGLPGVQTPNAIAVNNQGKLLAGTMVLFGSAEVYIYEY